MGGTNPYLGKIEARPAIKRFKIRVKNSNQVIEVDPDRIPYSNTGLPGSILEIALAHGINIDHACGGVCACSTCHVYVIEGNESCSIAQDGELDMLDNAPDQKPISRLACQCVPNGEKDLVIETPSWNRNLVRETH